MNDSNDITDTSVSGNSNNNTAADGELFIQQAKDYYSYSILHKITSFFHSSSTTNTNTNQQSIIFTRSKTRYRKCKRKTYKRPISQKDPCCRR